MTREQFISGVEFKFEEGDSDSYSYDGSHLVGYAEHEVLDVQDGTFTVDINGEVQTILFSILFKVN